MPTVLLALCLLLTFPLLAAAADEDPTLVHVEMCEDASDSVDAAEMLAMARAELGGGLVELPAPAAFEVSIRQDCFSRELFIQRVESPLPEQRVSLEDVPPELRARVAALALAEFVQGTKSSTAPPVPKKTERAEPGIKPKNAESTGSNAAAAAIRKQSVESARAWSIGAEGRVFVMVPTMTFGARTEFRYQKYQWAAFGLFGRRTDEVELRLGLFGLGIARQLYQRVRRLESTLSIGVEGGASWHQGTEVDSPVSSMRPYGAILLWWSLTGEPEKHALLRAQIGFGYSMGTEHSVERRRVVTTSGPLFTLVLSIGASR